METKPINEVREAILLKTSMSGIVLQIWTECFNFSSHISETFKQILKQEVDDLTWGMCMWLRGIYALQIYVGTDFTYFYIFSEKFPKPPVCFYNLNQAVKAQWMVHLSSQSSFQ